MVYYEERGILFSVSNDRKIIAWNINLMMKEKTLKGHSLEVNKILLDN